MRVVSNHDQQLIIQWTAPEILSGETPLGTWVDMWAVGVVTYLLYACQWCHCLPCWLSLSSLAAYVPFYAEDLPTQRKKIMAMDFDFDFPVRFEISDEGKSTNNDFIHSGLTINTAHSQRFHQQFSCGQRQVIHHQPMLYPPIFESVLHQLKYGLLSWHVFSNRIFVWRKEKQSSVWNMQGSFTSWLCQENWLLWCCKSCALLMQHTHHVLWPYHKCWASSSMQPTKRHLGTHQNSCPNLLIYPSEVLISYECGLWWLMVMVITLLEKVQRDFGLTTVLVDLWITYALQQQCLLSSCISCPVVCCLWAGGHFSPVHAMERSVC